ncbi:TPA: hypothetical protein HA259_03440, partial [Thermoplasmata archaeon]|nr:hypothetical protein [Thermoplasmata archaeon]
MFKGPALIGSFAGKIRDGELEVSDLDGGPDVKRIVDRYARMIGIRMRDDVGAGTSDWEVMEF